MGNIGKIGIVTVTYNSSSVIEGFMKSLLAQTYQEFILYIIDNASNDDTLDKIKKYQLDSRIIIVPNSKNLGVAAGNNQGIKAALEDNCSYILLINNDTEFNHCLLEKLLLGISKAGCDMIVPKMVYHDNQSLIWFAGGYFQPWKGYQNIHEGLGELDNGQYNEAKYIEYAPTCCMLIDKNVFEDVGLMDEKYFVYYDDTDFCLRTLRLNKRLYYLPSAVLTHKVSSLTGGGMSRFTTRYFVRNQVYYFRKHVWFPYAIILLIFMQVKFFLKLLMKIDNLELFLFKEKAFIEGIRL